MALSIYSIMETIPSSGGEQKLEFPSEYKPFENFNEVIERKYLEITGKNRLVHRSLCTITFQIKCKTSFPKKRPMLMLRNLNSTTN